MDCVDGDREERGITGGASGFNRAEVRAADFVSGPLSGDIYLVCVAFFSGGVGCGSIGVVLLCNERADSPRSLAAEYFQQEREGVETENFRVLLSGVYIPFEGARRCRLLRDMSRYLRRW